MFYLIPNEDDSEKDEIGKFLDSTKQDVHEGKMPFECNDCEAGFEEESHLLGMDYSLIGFHS